MAKGANTISKSDMAINAWYGEIKKIKLRQKFEIGESDATTQCLSANKPNIEFKERHPDTPLTNRIALSYKDRPDTSISFYDKCKAKAELLDLPVELIMKYPNLTKKK